MMSLKTTKLFLKQTYFRQNFVILCGEKSMTRKTWNHRQYHNEFSNQHEIEMALPQLRKIRKNILQITR